MGRDFAMKASTVQLVGRFRALPRWAKVAAVVAALLVVLGAVFIPVAAVAADERDRQLSLEAAAKESAAEKSAAEAGVLAEAKREAGELNAELAGLTRSLGAAVHPDAAAALEAARVQLAFAIADGELGDVSAAVDAVTGALDDLAASAEGQARALIDASPLAGASRDALTRAIADLAGADDLAAALTEVKAASDAVAAAQKAGAEEAAAAAAAEEAEAEAEAWGGGGSAAGGSGSGDGGGSVGTSEDPGIIGMEPGPRESCGENPTGQVVTLGFSWQAREGNTVDISYAYTDGDYQATGGFMLLASGRGSSGSVSIPVPCPVGVGPTPFVTVKAVAINANGSAAAYYWGL